MVFELYRSTRNRYSNSRSNIKAFFEKKNVSEPFYKFILNIQIGKKIADKINITPKDKILFYVDTENPRLFKIRKEDEQFGGTYRITFNSTHFVFKVTWNKFVPEERDFIRTLVDYQITEDNCLIIDFDKKLV